MTNATDPLKLECDELFARMDNGEKVSAEKGKVMHLSFEVIKCYICTITIYITYFASFL